MYEKMLQRTIRLAPLTRCVSTTPSFSLNQKWRQQRGLPLNPNTRGVLTDSPDYSFLDGRPTPYGVGQRNRILRQREIAETIIKLTKEIDFAVERHQKLVAEEKQQRKLIIDSKLKPKGINLLKKQ